MVAFNLRRALAVVGLLAVCGMPAGAGSPPAAPTTAASKVNMADHALRMLQEGNERFLEGKAIHPNTDVFRVNDTGEHGQHPFAAILTCADSRVAVERLFDRGVGDLFVVRVAGAVVDANQNGSIEYACEHLGTQLVVVMGHTKCGAVKAACAGADEGKNVASILNNITPAVQATKAKHPELVGDDMVDAVVRENVWESVEDMFKNSPMMREKVSSGAVRVVGAVYDVETGRVEWLGVHPALAGLLRGGNQEAASTGATTSPVPAEPKPADKPLATRPNSEKPTPATKPAGAKPTSTTAKPVDPDEHGPAQVASPH